MDTQQFSQKLQCRHCQNTRPMPIVTQFRRTIDTFEYLGNLEQEDRIYQLLQCPACSEVTLQTTTWCDVRDDGSDVTYDILYPAATGNDPSPMGLPDTIRKAFAAAQSVKTIDPNAYGVLLGRVLELVCLDRKAQGNTLAEQLKDLALKNEIPDKLVNVANSLRNLRNIGAHATLGNLTIEEIPILTSLCSAILEYVYTAPHLANEAEARLKKIQRSS